MEAVTMPSYMIRNLPDGLIGRAKTKAHEQQTSLDAVLIRYLETYAEHGNPQAKGARAVNESRTPEERSEAARKAVQARWAAKKKAESTDKPAKKKR